jgi:CheY-like chemotaxis protein
MNTHTSLPPIHILLADDDHDDRFLFARELEALPFNTDLSVVEDGEKLMTYLEDSFNRLPDIIFLDNNMPCKNGEECIQEIKAHSKLKLIPVIIYSTYVHEDVADAFYTAGAHFYIRKTDQKELRKLLQQVLTLYTGDRFSRPKRTAFVLNAPTTKGF